MFPSKYYGPRYFAGNYFPEVGGSASATTNPLFGVRRIKTSFHRWWNPPDPVPLEVESTIALSEKNRRLEEEELVIR